jgi:chromosome segregation ATPase
MKRICSEVDEATEEVIMKTRAESAALIASFQNDIHKLKQELEHAKRVAKYDLDDLARANRSLRQELEESNEEILKIYTELETKTNELDALNEDVERFAETFAAQHEEVQQLERQLRRLQDENDSLKALNTANTKLIAELQNAFQGKAHSIGTPVDQERRMWKELAKMRKEIQNMHNNQMTLPNHSVQDKHSQQRRPGYSSDISSDEDEDEKGLLDDFIETIHKVQR